MKTKENDVQEENVPQLGMKELVGMMASQFGVAAKEYMQENGLGAAELKHGIFPTAENPNGDPQLSKGNEKVEKFFRAVAQEKKGVAFPVEMKTLTEGANAGGGYLVPEEFSNRFFTRATEGEVVRPRATVIRTSRDSLSMPALDQSSGEFGGLAVGYVNEGGTKPETEPAFKTNAFVLNKIAFIIPATDELLEDSVINLEDLLLRLASDAIRYFEDKEYLVGVTAGKISGIINTTNTVARGVAATISFDDLIAMENAMKPSLLPGATFILSQAAAGSLRTKKDTTGRYMWQPAVAEGQLPTINGRPVLVTEKLPALGTAGDALLARLADYYILERSDIRVTSSIHYKYAQDITAWRFVHRVDGMLMDNASAVKLIG